MGIVHVLIMMFIIWLFNLVRMMIFNAVFKEPTPNESDYTFRITLAILFAAWIIRYGGLW